MNYIEQKKKYLIHSFLVFILCFFTFYRLHYLIPGIAEHCGACVLYPFLKLYAFCFEPIKIYRADRKTIAQLNDQLLVLQQNNNILRAENIEFKATQTYMQDIQEIISFKKRYHHDAAHVAQIMARYISSDSHYLYVDAGTLAGISSNMIALYNNILIGHVIESYPWYSKIQLITDPLASISVYNVQTGARGIYKGNGTDNGVVMRMSHLEKISVGDELYSSGEGLLYPQGYLVGTVSSCKTEGLYHTIAVAPAINTNTIHYCTLLARC